MYKEGLKVSIIIPVYNIEEYIRNTVKSVILQTYKNIEAILVDDGSTDKSGKICDELAAEYENVKVVHKPNGGLSSARNAGMNVVSGEFIMFLDGDDYLALNAVEYLMNIYDKTKADIVQFGYEETDREYSEIKAEVRGEYTVETDQKRFFEKLYEIGGEAASACTKLYKKELFDDLRFKEGIIHEDEYMATRMLAKVKRVAYIPEKLYFYVMRGGSIIRSGFNEKKLDFFVVSDDRIKMLQKFRFYDILELEYRRRFMSLMNFYCLAAISQNTSCKKKIIGLIKDYYRRYNYEPNGRMKTFYVLCRIDPHMVHIYYLFRKYFGHIELG